MKYYEYQIYSAKLPTRLTLHSVVTHFFGSKNLSATKYRVCQEGKVIKIFTCSEIKDEFSVVLTDRKGVSFECKLFRTVEHSTIDYSNGDEVLVSGIISYGATLKGVARSKSCPVFKGRFNSSVLIDLFKLNIERNLGVVIPEMRSEYFCRLEPEILSYKIQLNNTIDVNLKVQIIEAELFKSIHFNSFFQRKSYGFGSFTVIG